MANEKRLIDANALRDDTFILDAWDAKIVRAWLDDQPTVDAVEVVRCKDCRKCEKAINVHTGRVFKCNLYNPNDGRRYKNPNDFCSYGERREGE